MYLYVCVWSGGGVGSHSRSPDNYQGLFPQREGNLGRGGGAAGRVLEEPCWRQREKSELRDQ